MRRRFLRKFARWALFFSVLSTTAILYLNWDLLGADSPGEQQRVRRFKPLTIPSYQCPVESLQDDVSNARSAAGRGVRPHSVKERILLVASTADSTSLIIRNLSTFLEYLKVPIRVVGVDEGWRSEWPLELAGVGRFTLVIFADYRFYLNMRAEAKVEIDRYCSKFNVGLISLLPSRRGEDGEEEEKLGEALTVFNRQQPRNLRFPQHSPIRRVARAGVTLPYTDGEQALMEIHKDVKGVESVLDAEDYYGNKRTAGVLIKSSSNDGSEAVEHIILSNDPSFGAIAKLALLDSLIYMAPNIADAGLERFIQIDIDDVFVGQSGTRMLASDVIALVETQRELQRYVDNFRFTLGFSGYFYLRGDDRERIGDEELIAWAGEFHWFPHMWRHNHAHEYTEDYLTALMMQNKFFAEANRLPTDLGYAVSPQHSGVYPIHKPLYRAWRRVWNASVTSSEEYPHLRPPSRRIGFQHFNISVLPRQTCGLFTHTSHFHTYPGGVEKLKANIHGGDLFTTMLMAPSSIFMTHQQNYANDRLGSYTFTSLMRFLRCWTTLKLDWTAPTEMAQRYFNRFPKERKLLYTDSCTDTRHRRMLPVNSSLCSAATQLPNLLILGPQKTGTSALSLFLSLHPRVATNLPINGSFEELQFFNGANYHRGVEWYREKFPVGEANASVVFEKSANYFDSVDGPAAVHALLPNARLVVIMIDPVDRAYSWFQHMRTLHPDTYRNYTAEEVFVTNSSQTAQLRRRCLLPGLYAQHMDRWLDYFPASRLIVIDGERLKTQPAAVMNELMGRLALSRRAFNPDERIKFVPSKGFHCAVKVDGKLKCLGRSKGRKYEPMSDRVRGFLQNYYAIHNEALIKLLMSYDYPVPAFLRRPVPNPPF